MSRVSEREREDNFLPVVVLTQRVVQEEEELRQRPMSSGGNDGCHGLGWWCSSLQPAAAAATMATMIYRLPTVPTPNWLPPLATSRRRGKKNKIRGVDPNVLVCCNVFDISLLIHCLCTYEI